MKPPEEYGPLVVMSKEEIAFINAALVKYGPKAQATYQAMAAVMDDRIKTTIDFTLEQNDKVIEEYGVEGSEFKRVVHSILCIEKNVQYENLKLQTILQYNRLYDGKDNAGTTKK